MKRWRCEIHNGTLSDVIRRNHLEIVTESRRPITTARDSYAIINVSRDKVRFGIRVRVREIHLSTIPSARLTEQFNCNFTAYP